MCKGPVSGEHDGVALRDTMESLGYGFIDDTTVPLQQLLLLPHPPNFISLSLFFSFLPPSLLPLLPPSSFSHQDQFMLAQYSWVCDFTLKQLTYHGLHF